MEKLDLEEQISEIGSKVTMMYYALMGSDLTKDGGLIRRIDEIEDGNKVRDKRIAEVSKRQDKSNIYVNILWAAAGIIMTLVLHSFFK